MFDAIIGICIGIAVGLSLILMASIHGPDNPRTRK